MKVKNRTKKVKVIRPLHGLQVLLSVLPGTLGGQKTEKYLKLSLESESQKYNQESESDMAFACVAGPAECITRDWWQSEC